MENFDKFSNKLNLGKRSEYRNCESCGGEGCPDCYGFGSSMKNPEFDKAKEEYLKLKRSMRGIENDDRDPGHGEMVTIANIRIGELDREFPGLKDLPELKDLKENKLTTMEKKLITEMKFMMERLESPRMTYTQYEKKRNNLIKENTNTEILKYLQKTFGGDIKNNQLQIQGGGLITVDGNDIEYVNVSKMMNQDFMESPKRITIDFLKSNTEEAIEGMKEFLKDE